MDARTTHLVSEVEALAAVPREGAQLFARILPMAMDNLMIVQHPDKLHYAHTQGGGYLTNFSLANMFNSKYKATIHWMWAATERS